MTDYSDIKRRLRDRALLSNLSKDAADAIEALEKERDEAQTRAHDAEGNLASLADALNIGARENGMRQVVQYLDLNEMRGAVNSMAIALGNARARVAELEKERDEARRSDAESLELYRRSRERLEARVAELDLESKRDKAHIEALAAEVDAWREKPMAQELRDLHEKMAVLRARVAELERLLRSRCEHYCFAFRSFGKHSPECLVEEAGIK